MSRTERCRRTTRSVGKGATSPVPFVFLSCCLALVAAVVWSPTRATGTALPAGCRTTPGPLPESVVVEKCNVFLPTSYVLLSDAHIFAFDPYSMNNFTVATAIASSNPLRELGPYSFAGANFTSHLSMTACMQLTVIRSWAFKGVVAKDAIYLDSNAIAVIEPDAFNGARIDGDLDLMLNNITVLGAYALQGVKVGRGVSLTDMGLLVIQPMAFYMASMGSLYLSNIPITTMVSGVFDGATIGAVYIERNPDLTTFEPLLFTQARVSSITVKDNPSLATIGADAFNFGDDSGARGSSLMVANNALTSLTSLSFARLTLTGSVTVDEPALTEIQVHAFWDSVVDGDVSIAGGPGNLVVDSMAFRNLRVGGTLRITSTGLTALPPRAFGSTSASVLDLRGAGLRTLGPLVFQGTPNITDKLYLGANITYLPYELVTNDKFPSSLEVVQAEATMANKAACNAGGRGVAQWRSALVCTDCYPGYFCPAWRAGIRIGQMLQCPEGTGSLATGSDSNSTCVRCVVAPGENVGGFARCSVSKDAGKKKQQNIPTGWIVGLGVVSVVALAVLGIMAVKWFRARRQATSTSEPVDRFHQLEEQADVLVDGDDFTPPRAARSAFQ